MKFVIYLILLRVSFSYGECSSKEGVLGKCKPFIECLYMNEVVHSISVYALLKQYGGCGIRNNNLHLCCPDKTPSETNPSTPEPSIVIKISQLFEATRMGNQARVEDLLKDGLNVDFLIGGYTALMIAAYYGQDSVVEKLINAGADAGIKNANGNTALMVAAKEGRNSVVERLIRAGADVNIQNSRGESALHLAAQNRHLLVVKSLLNAGADVGLKTNAGRTASEVAVQKQHLDVADLIQASDDSSRCEDGWVLFANSCYFFGKDEGDWFHGRQRCLSLGADYVKITENSEWNFLLNQEGNFWIGLNDLQEEGVYKWISDNSTMTDLIWNWWHAGNPDNNYEEGEQCVQYLYFQGKKLWNDAYCHSKFPYICEMRAAAP